MIISVSVRTSYFFARSYLSAKDVVPAEARPTTKQELTCFPHMCQTCKNSGFAHAADHQNGPNGTKEPFFLGSSPPDPD